MKQENNVWFAIYGIAILVICFLIASKYVEEPKKETGIANTDFKDQKY